MTDGINRLSGYGNYGVGPYIPNRNNGKDSGVEDENTQANANHDEPQIDPNKVMEFLAQNNYFIGQTSVESAKVDPNNIDEETKERIAGWVQQYTMIMDVVIKEFGEEAAPKVMDVIMDILMNILYED